MNAKTVQTHKTVQTQRRLIVLVAVGIVLCAALLAFRSYQARPADDYRFHTPPPGPNARPDPPNPGKLKLLPGALSPGK